MAAVMSESLAIAVSALTAATLLVGLAGISVRFVLLPWLREHLVEPVAATQHQVTENGQRSDVPTVPDLLHGLSRQVQSMDQAFAAHIAAHDEERRKRTQ